jgi:hypothetical protein
MYETKYLIKFIIYAGFWFSRLSCKNFTKEKINQSDNWFFRAFPTLSDETRFTNEKKFYTADFNFKAFYGLCFDKSW